MRLRYRVLIDAGARVNVRDTEGHTALWEAQRVCKSYLGAGSSEDITMEESSAASAAATLKRLKRAGARR